MYRPDHYESRGSRRTGYPFSKFAPSVHDEEDSDDDGIDEPMDGTDEVLDLFKKLHEGRKAAEKLAAGENRESSKMPSDEENDVSGLTRIFLFRSLYAVTSIAGMLGKILSARTPYTRMNLMAFTFWWCPARG